MCVMAMSLISQILRGIVFFLLLFKFFIKRIRVRILSTSLLQLLNYPKKSSARVYVMAQIINAKSIQSKVAKKNSF